MRRGVSLGIAAIVWAMAGPAAAGGAAEEAVLPPAPPWSGKSRSLAVGAAHEWVTPCEKSGFKETPRYDDTMLWLLTLEESSPHVKLVSLGKSPEGRDIYMVVASLDGFTPGSLGASGKPILLAQAGIHSGEIDGKDAGMMFLRDLTVRGTKSALLEKASFLFIPIFSVDGHERFSRFSRINQRGPVESGWRTTSRNLNLNRDYAKADSPEMRAVIRAFDIWAPDLYLDIHVTNGADYQYDITWGYNGTHAYSPELAGWMDAHLTPQLTKSLEQWGHVPGPLVFPVDGKDLSKGIRSWTAGQRYSHGYGDARHMASVLVENHSLKPYDQRVLGTYVFLEAAMKALGEHGKALREAREKDRVRRLDPVPLTWKEPEGEPPKVPFKGIENRVVDSRVSGQKRVEWSGKPVDLEVPVFATTVPDMTVVRFRAYWIPPAWTEVIARLEVHGVKLERIAAPRRVEVEMLRLVEPQLSDRPCAGQVRGIARVEPERHTIEYPAGAVRVPTDQPLGTLAILLLEPESPDSFFQWGFFHEVLQRAEYVDAYVVEPMAEGMLKESPELKREFEQRLKDDPEFAADPKARLMWFYRRTPFFDERWNLYPVAREISARVDDG